MTDKKSDPKSVTFTVKLSNDRNFVSVAVLRDEEVVAGNDLDAGDLDELIELLGAARAGLKDAVPAMPDPGSRVRTIDRPVIAVQAVAPTTDQLLLVRDEAYGWTAFRLKQKLAHELGRLLLELPGK